MMSLADVSKFIKTSLKHGSFLIALFIPIMLLLDAVDFVPRNFMYLINATIIFIELGLALFHIVLNEYLKAKALIAGVNQDIEAGKPELAKEKIKDHISEVVSFAKNTTKEIIDYVKDKKKPEVIEPIETPETTPKEEIIYP